MLYHGSEKIIDKPEKKKGKLNNDYGQGFYMTEDFDMAGEWACKNMNDGFINCYELYEKNLKKLNLYDDKYNILHWLNILLKNRRFNLDTEISINGKKFLNKNFNIDLDKYDIIKGYRADDSYFSFADDFLNNIITYGKLKNAFMLGRLGTQIFINTEKAFKNIIFKASHPAESCIYYPRYKMRDDDARLKYFTMRGDINKKENFYLSDILKGEIDIGSL